MDRPPSAAVSGETTNGGKKRLLFFCSGNYYRSRLAEILFNHYAAEAGLPWEASSRGLIQTGELKGMSEHTIAFLKSADLGHLTKKPRNPIVMDVEDLTEADLVVGLCRAEHKPMLEQKFLSLAKALQKTGRVRFWNVYDIPSRPHAILRLLGGGQKGPHQPNDSGTEHIALAVNALIWELATQDPTETQND